MILVTVFGMMYLRRIRYESIVGHGRSIVEAYATAWKKMVCRVALAVTHQDDGVVVGKAVFDLVVEYAIGLLRRIFLGLGLIVMLTYSPLAPFIYTIF